MSVRQSDALRLTGIPLTLLRRVGPRLTVLVLALFAAASPFASAEPAVASAVTTVELTIVGGPALNPNLQGRASPVVVRIFDLGASKAFESADYPALFEHPGEPLKRDLLAQEEFVLRPGDIQQRNRDLPAQVQMLGIAAAFRDLEHAVWHLSVPLKPGAHNFLLVNLDLDTIRLVTEPGQK